MNDSMQAEEQTPAAKSHREARTEGEQGQRLRQSWDIWRKMQGPNPARGCAHENLQKSKGCISPRRDTRFGNKPDAVQRSVS